MAPPWLPFLFLLLAVAVLLLSSSSSAVLSLNAQKPVYDLDGDALVAGKGYFVLPTFRGRGGGLTLASRPGVECPLYVAQAKLGVDRGLPAEFTPANGTAGDTVLASTDVTIAFRASTACIQSTQWHLTDVEGSDGARYIATGSYRGDDDRSNLFRIVPNEITGLHSYVLVHCPCSHCKLQCFNIGVLRSDGSSPSFLGILGGSDQLSVMFGKAPADVAVAAE